MSMTERFSHSEKCASQRRIVKEPSKTLLGLGNCCNAAGFNVNGATTGYSYDLNGNLYSDPYKKITANKYYD
jgi:hypothetical protein